MELQERLRSHLVEMVRERDPYFASAGHFYVKQYIRELWGQWGSMETHSFSHQGQIYENLILNLPGSDGRKERSPILLGAHYDAVPGTPGADDNATGIAVLLELGREFAVNPLPYPVRLVAFDLEEYGMVGSWAYAMELKEQGQLLRLMLSLEMLGYCDPAPGSQQYPHKALEWLYPREGNFIGLIGTLTVIPDLLRLNQAMSRFVRSRWIPAGIRGQVLPASRLSDHSPFWDLGYPALMVTDTSFLRNPHYHRASDRLETLDLNFLTQVCQGLMAGLRGL